jgi:hypothetical protein
MEYELSRTLNDTNLRLTSVCCRKGANTKLNK